MIFIGCDYNPAFQQIALVDTETGELQERRLQHREEGDCSIARKRRRSTVISRPRE